MALRSHGEDHNDTATTMVIKHTIERTQGCVCTEIKGGWLIPPAHTSGKYIVLERPKTDLHWSHILQACLDCDCPCLGSIYYTQHLEGVLRHVHDTVIRCFVGKGKGEPKLILGPGCHSSTSWGDVGLETAWSLSTTACWLESWGRG